MSNGPKAPSDQTSTPSSYWKAFSQKAWVIVIGGILFPPVGMILTWLKPGWSTRTKWIATGVLGLLLIGRNGLQDEAPAGDPSASVSTEAGDAEERRVTVAAERPTDQPVKKMPPEKELAVARDKQPPKANELPLKRNWFESDHDYFTRGVNALAKQLFSTENAACELAPASQPWRGFRGKVRLHGEQRLVEVHRSGSTFVVVFYTFSRWLGFPADFRDAAGEAITQEEFCKRSYSKTPEEVTAIFDAEQDKHQTAKSLWNLATNEVALRKRLPGRFTVEGEVFQVRQEYGQWIVRLFVHENARGVDRWVECLMSDGKGLEKVSQGTRITIEGVFNKTRSAGPEMNACRVVD